MKGIIDYWWNANTRLNVIYSRGSYAINEQKHYYTWNLQENVKSKAHAQDGLQGIWRSFLVKIVDENSGIPFLILCCFEVCIWSEYRKELASQTDCLLINLLQVWSHAGQGHPRSPGQGFGCAPGHQGALGWDWEPKNCARTWAMRGE